VMRAYIEKPRTTVGWKGLVYDPQLDGSGDMARGLELSRRLMLQMIELGLPLASELLQPLVAGYVDGLRGWAARGARTSESQSQRELVSGLGMAVGFKTGTDGSMGIAIDAMRSAAAAHQHFGMDELGRPALVETRGNPDTHLVLRGGNQGPNFDAASVAAARTAPAQAGVDAATLVDCSPGNRRPAACRHGRAGPSGAGRDPGQPGHPPGAAWRQPGAELRRRERGRRPLRAGSGRGGCRHHGRLQPRQQRQGPAASTCGTA